MSLADEAEPLPAPLDLETEAQLLAALEAALRPAALDRAVNERLIEQALEDPLAPASSEELAESARLRDALEAGSAHEDAGALTALRAAFGAGASEPTRLEQAITAAVAAPAQAPRGRGNVIYALFGGAAAVLAAAAALVLVVGGGRSEAPSLDASAAGQYSKPRSTAPLFEASFQTAATSARIDLIASVRSRDLRDNRYAAWGVR